MEISFKNIYTVFEYQLLLKECIARLEKLDDCESIIQDYKNTLETYRKEFTKVWESKLEQIKLECWTWNTWYAFEEYILYNYIEDGRRFTNVSYEIKNFLVKCRNRIKNIVE